MSFMVPQNPWSGVAESAVTSLVLDARDAFDIAFSFYTTSGTSSVFTYQVSGSSVGPDSIAEASWSNWTLVIPPSGASVREVPLAYPWARIIRTASGASWAMQWNKQVYG